MRTLLAALLSSAALLPAIDVPLVADAHTRLSQPALNNGALPQLQIAPGESNSFFFFDLAPLPPGVIPSQVAKATLTVFVNRVLTAGSLSAGAVNAPWTEQTITAGNAPLIQVSAVALASQSNSFVSFDVTNDVRNWIATPSLNYGLGIASSGSNVLLDSKENTATSKQARLEITLAGPQGATGATGSVGPIGLTGATGPTGPSSLAGLIRVSSGTFTILNGTAQAANLGCSAPYPILVSGGCGFTLGADNISVLKSAPLSASQNVWQCMGRNTSGSDRTMEIFVICSK